jgi:hypothetical protein
MKKNIKCGYKIKRGFYEAVARKWFSSYYERQEPGYITNWSDKERYYLGRFFDKIQEENDEYFASSNKERALQLINEFLGYE